MVKSTGVRWGVGFIAVVLMVMAFGGLSVLAKTPAGTVISNQAVAEYMDSSDVKRTATSNIVYVTVQQVAAVQVSPSAADDPANDPKVQVVPGQTVHYSFDVTNTGNGDDTFDVTLAKSVDVASGATTMELFRDVNGNGVIDAGDVEVSVVGPVAPGDTVNLIARLRVPLSADPDENEVIKIQLNAESQADGDVTGQSAEITFVVVKEGVISASLNAASNDATDTTRVLPGGTITYTVTLINQGMTSVNGAKLTLNLPSSTSLLSGTLQVNGAELDDPVSFPTEITLDAIGGGQARVITYEVKVDGDAEVGFITNQATVKVGENPSVHTNQVQTRVRHVAKVKIEENGGTYSYDSTDIGATYSFPYTVTNEGNGPDQILIDATIDNEWVVAVYAADGVTPLPKHEGKYTVGNLASGANANIVVNVTVPTSAKSDNATHTVSVTASSAADSAETAIATATLANVNGAGVTLSVVGDKEKTGNPGTVVEYEIDVKNEGPAQDLFNVTIPAIPGYVFEFFDESGNPISDITVSGNGTEKIIVRVTIPAGTTPESVSFDVKVTSQNDPGMSDEVELTLGVNGVVSVSIAPNRTGSVNRGGYTTYTLELQNLGNTEQTITLSTSVLGGGAKRLGYVFLDADNAVIDETQDVTLKVGGSATIKVRADAGTQLAVGTVETVRVIAKVNDVTVDSATLQTTVTGGELQLSKEADKTKVDPGEQITYTITATNISVGPLKAVEIFEKIPEHTTFVAAATDATDVAIKYSDDGGTTWNAPAGPSVTDVKWVLDASKNLPAGANIEVTLTVEVK